MRRWLGDAGSALLALVLAVLVWLVASESERPLEERAYPPAGAAPLPIEYRGIPQGWAVYEPSASEVRLRLRGVREALDTLNNGSFTAWADLADVDPEASVATVPIRARCEGCGRAAARIVAVVPPMVTIQLEPAITSIGTVTVELEDALLQACRDVEFRIRPATVTVTGARSRVERLDAIVARIGDVTVETAHVARKDVPLHTVDAQGLAVGDLTLEPETVDITLTVVNLETCAETFVRAVYNDPPPGYYVTEITVEPRTVELRGDPERLETLREEGLVLTRVLDLSDTRERVERLVALDLPEGVEPVGAAEGVTVSIRVSPLPGAKTFDLPVTAVGIADGLELAGVAPSRVQVLLSGPLPVLDAIAAEELIAEVNLEGLGPGVHRLAPILSGLPASVRVRSATPDQVDVRLQTP